MIQVKESLHFMEVNKGSQRLSRAFILVVVVLI